MAPVFAREAVECTEEDDATSGEGVAAGTLWVRRPPKKKLAAPPDEVGVVEDVDAAAGVAAVGNAEGEDELAAAAAVSAGPLLASENRRGCGVVKSC